MDEDTGEIDTLKLKIHADRGFNCHLYKDKCLRRRFAVRMRARGIESFLDYAKLLDADPVEYDRLLDTLTINVTKFFRNWSAWQVLRNDVLPSLLTDPMLPPRVWSAGCASGEEPYSVAILLREVAAEMGVSGDESRLRILGTDIDRRSLNAAEEGSYADLSFEETPVEIRERWFSAGPHYRLNEEARRGVEFMRSDLISDQPPVDQSLIICRNVIIYFDRSVQEQLFQMFYDSLVPGGFLVLGRVETLLGRPRSLFRPIEPRERIYVKPRR